MLLFALALHGATTIADDPQRHRRPRLTRVTRIPPRAAPYATNLAITVPADPNQRYRLPLPSTEITDRKTDAVRSTGMACGTTGAPVCPHNGTQLVKTAIDD